MSHDDACAPFADDWSVFVDGELPAARAAELRAHLAGCADCTARVEALRGVDRALAGLPSRRTPPDLRARLQARLDAGEGEAPPAPRVLPGRRTPSSRRRGLGAAALAAAAAAAAVVIYVTMGGAPGPIHPTPEATIARVPAVDRDFDAATAEDLAVASELDTIEDLGVIANLELLEMFVAAEEGGTG